jgi:hypothetical protein
MLTSISLLHALSIHILLTCIGTIMIRVHPVSRQVRRKHTPSHEYTTLCALVDPLLPLLYHTEPDPGDQASHSNTARDMESANSCEIKNEQMDKLCCCVLYGLMLANKLCLPGMAVLVPLAARTRYGLDDIGSGDGDGGGIVSDNTNPNPNPNPNPKYLPFLTQVEVLDCIVNSTVRYALRGQCGWMRKVQLCYQSKVEGCSVSSGSILEDPSEGTTVSSDDSSRSSDNRSHSSTTHSHTSDSSDCSSFIIQNDDSESVYTDESSDDGDGSSDDDDEQRHVLLVDCLTNACSGYIAHLQSNATVSGGGGIDKGMHDLRVDTNLTPVSLNTARGLSTLSQASLSALFPSALSSPASPLGSESEGWKTKESKEDVPLFACSPQGRSLMRTTPQHPLPKDKGRLRGQAPRVSLSAADGTSSNEGTHDEDGNDESGPIMMVQCSLDPYTSMLTPKRSRDKESTSNSVVEVAMMDCKETKQTLELKKEEKEDGDRYETEEDPSGVASRLQAFDARSICNNRSGQEGKDQSRGRGRVLVVKGLPRNVVAILEDVEQQGFGEGFLGC